MSHLADSRKYYYIASDRNPNSAFHSYTPHLPPVGHMSLFLRKRLKNLYNPLHMIDIQQMNISLSLICNLKSISGMRHGKTELYI
jgi:hypothetical protein